LSAAFPLRIFCFVFVPVPRIKIGTLKNSLNGMLDFVSVTVSFDSLIVELGSMQLIVYGNGTDAIWLVGIAANHAMKTAPLTLKCGVILHAEHESATAEIGSHGSGLC
jgi:hypothetical protein